MRMEVFYVVAHLLITLSLLAGYMYSVHIGSPDTTLQNGILIVLGYWFGSMGADKVKGLMDNSRKGGNENE